jgi:hypothetical protein
MTDKQPEALEWAAAVAGIPQLALFLRTQHAEIERLNACIKWEQNRAERIGTHGPGCEKWGPAHYECALQAIERKDALLKQALDALCLPCDCSSLELSKPVGTAVDAIIKELSQ